MCLKLQNNSGALKMYNDQFSNLVKHVEIGKRYRYVAVSLSLLYCLTIRYCERECTSTVHLLSIILL